MMSDLVLNIAVGVFLGRAAFHVFVAAGKTLLEMIEERKRQKFFNQNIETE